MTEPKIGDTLTRADVMRLVRPRADMRDDPPPEEMLKDGFRFESGRWFIRQNQADGTVRRFYWP